MKVTVSFSESENLGYQDYVSLLGFAREVCDSMSLIVRPSLGLSLSHKGYTLLDNLRSFLKEEADVQSWPGTVLIERSAHLYRFAYNAEVSTILQSVSTCLFDWLQPALPEDICFYRPDSSVWLTTISHEHDAYFSIPPSELEEIKSRLPGLYSRMLL